MGGGYTNVMTYQSKGHLLSMNQIAGAVFAPIVSKCKLAPKMLPATVVRRRKIDLLVQYLKHLKNMKSK